MKLIMVAGGELDQEFLQHVLDEAGPDRRIMGIDAGVLAVEVSGYTPDYVIGDFDSVSAEERQRILDTYQEKRVLCPVKDDTDLEAAIHWILEGMPVGDEAEGIPATGKVEGGIEEVLLLGMTGNRMDHTLTNLRLMAHFPKAGIPAVMLDRKNRIRILTGSVKIKKEELYGPYISLLPVFGAVEGITLKGFKYAIENAVLEPMSSLGVSNELIEPVGEILYPEGLLYLMETKDGQG